MCKLCAIVLILILTVVEMLCAVFLTDKCDLTTLSFLVLICNLTGIGKLGVMCKAYCPE